MMIDDEPVHELLMYANVSMLSQHEQHEYDAFCDIIGNVKGIINDGMTRSFASRMRELERKHDTLVESSRCLRSEL